MSSPPPRLQRPAPKPPPPRPSVHSHVAALDLDLARSFDVHRPLALHIQLLPLDPDRPFALHRDLLPLHGDIAVLLDGDRRVPALNRELLADDHRLVLLHLLLE